MSEEQFYDDEIAPELLRMAKLCSDRGIPFMAFVEFDGITGHTSSRFEIDEATSATAVVHCAMRCKGNLDALVIGASKLEQARGHDSLILTMVENKDLR